MDIQHSFDVLELDKHAGIDDARQAYKDMVNIWHPDRFSNNHRLKQKAEDKLKEINAAYETVQSYLYSKKPPQSEKTTDAKTDAGANHRTEEGSRPKYHESYTEAGAKDKTEAFFETGTSIVLNLFSYLSSAVRRMVTEAKTEIDQGTMNQWQTKDDMRGKFRDGGMGSGKRMGRGGRRGGGRGRGRGL